MLVISWGTFFSFLITHQRHATRFRGASETFRSILYLSTSIGSIVGIVLMGYYFTQVGWYWPFLLFIVGGLAGTMTMGFVYMAIGEFPVSLLAFIGWPLGAVWTFIIMRSLNAG